MTNDVHAGLYQRLAAEGVEVVGEFRPDRFFDALSFVLSRAYQVDGHVNAELIPVTDTRESA